MLTSLVVFCRLTRVVGVKAEIVELDGFRVVPIAVNCILHINN